MNAVPLKPGPSLADVMDELIASYGVRGVMLALAAKMVKRTRPPDTKADLALRGQPELDLMPDRLRADIGLEPKPKQCPYVLLGTSMHRPYQ